MEKVNLELVYQDSGVPQYTFVTPSEYTKTHVSLRTKGKGVIVEGPSGIGKTTCIQKIIEEEKIHATFLSARKQGDLEIIDMLLSNPRGQGMVIIDDFHLLPNVYKKRLSDLLKVLADESREDVKLVLIGINRAGECLIQLAPDLNNRIDTIRFERNSKEKIKELVEKGERILNIDIQCKEELINRAYGSFHIAQMLCKTLCISHNIIETQDITTPITTSFDEVVRVEMQELARVFSQPTKLFAAGNRNRRDGRTPYFKLLIWLSESESSAIQMQELSIQHPDYKVSLSQIAEKGYISNLISKHEEISKVISYEPSSKILAVEDPKYIFYIKNLNWDSFAREMGFRISDYDGQSYEFALSFSGAKRSIAEKIYERLSENEYAVFYDKGEIPVILGHDLKEVLSPIYGSKAKYVIAMFDSTYPQKVWAVFESEQYKERFGEGAIIPIVFSDFVVSPTGPLYGRGYEYFDLDGDIDKQVEKIVGDIISKFESET